MKAIIWFVGSAIMLALGLVMGHLWSSSHDLGEAASASIFGLVALVFIVVGLKALAQDGQSA
ncbi:hypothetical protein R70006_04934 [Paraburkholderia domus]|uniref:hypothetical protein n=1 Tax=Paraburkholderia domus TaxID=2793075 RepID=UPI001914CFBA|nr:hypothetical protein [Paraburkholderia domus]MBK5051827.1 hypothetical protein [Burkholderia sp. R-70006]CAE6792982.1 hypothetical protein R70006_04934 [Paraburkholderia domus]